MNYDTQRDVVERRQDDDAKATCGATQERKESSEGFSEKTITRFWSKVDKRGEDECWEWIGGKTKKGYGAFAEGGISGRILRAHRVSFVIRNGIIPFGLMVCHRCDNPSCVNPQHLFLGTAKKNSEDMVHKKRNYHITNPEKLARGPRKFSKRIRRGVNHYSAKVTNVDVLAIRSSGLSSGKLAKIYGVNKSTIQRIILRKSWRYL